MQVWSKGGSERRIGLLAEGVQDVGQVYAVALPLFLIASLMEFVAR